MDKTITNHSCDIQLNTIRFCLNRKHVRTHSLTSQTTEKKSNPIISSQSHIIAFIFPVGFLVERKDDESASRLG